MRLSVCVCALIYVYIYLYVSECVCIFMCMTVVACIALCVPISVGRLVAAWLHFVVSQVVDSGMYRAILCWISH